MTEQTTKENQWNGMTSINEGEYDSETKVKHGKIEIKDLLTLEYDTSYY